ncbi:MAG: hypothetical protein HFI10_00950 [Lachnospiraceae bacterium]|nr:hypothetical protein [Lachnospiraceae bacterium]
MKYIRKKWIITGIIMMMGAGLTGCTKNGENAEADSGFAVEAEDLPGADALENGEAPAGDGADGEPLEGKPADEENPGTEDTDNKAGHIPDGEGDLLGDIYEVGEGQFTVTEIYTETLDDGSGIMVMGAPGTETESVKITVVYDDNTVFEKQKIWDGGANHEEKEGSAADLQKGFTTKMWGSYEGDVFHATAIRIVEVILG